MLVNDEFMKIPFFNYPDLYLSEKDTFLRIFDEICSRGAFILQKEVDEFEKKLSEFSNSKVVGVANATDGLELCWMALSLRPGDEVICSSHTMLATASSIKLNGGIPVPVDINEDDFLIDPKSIENAINSRTVGIMPTHLNGRTCNMDPIMKIAKEHKLFVVEDAAQALGSTFRGRHSGTFGNCGAISFYPAKVLGSFGDAGAVLTNDQSTYDRIYQLHDHGRNIEGEVISWGRNSRIDNLQAAFINHKFRKYSEVISRRREIADYYHKNLYHIRSLQLPPPPVENGLHFDVYQNYEVLAEKRDDLKDYLSEHGIGTLIQWGGKGVHQWERLGFNSIILPKTENFFNKCIMLPINMSIKDFELDYICQKILKFYS